MIVFFLHTVQVHNIIIQVVGKCAGNDFADAAIGTVN
jgi:hypothetical protein